MSYYTANWVFVHRYKGIALKGDPKAPPTKWWSHLYLLWRVWKEVTILEPEDMQEVAPYKVGYIPFEGPAKIRKRPVAKRRFAVRHGHEDCTFFAYAMGVENNCREIRLRIVQRTTMDKLPPDVELV